MTPAIKISLKKLSAPTQKKQNASVGRGGLEGLIQVETRLPEGTPETSFSQSGHP